MFCGKCGAENLDANRFCQKCGKPMAAEVFKAEEGRVSCPNCGAEKMSGGQFCPLCGSSFSQRAPNAASSATSLDPNTAGLLCYLLGWVTGLFFIVTEKENKFVRFHAMQSIVVFGAFTVLLIVLCIMPAIGSFLGIIGGALWFTLCVVLMMKAYQGEKFKLPRIGDIAEQYS